MAPQIQQLVDAYIADHTAGPNCPHYFDRLHRYAPGGMDQRGLLSMANSELDATGGQLYRCFCGGARLGADPNESHIPHPPEYVIDPRGKGASGK